MVSEIDEFRGHWVCVSIVLDTIFASDPSPLFGYLNLPLVQNFLLADVVHPAFLVIRHSAIASFKDFAYLVSLQLWKSVVELDKVIIIHPQVEIDCIWADYHF